MPHASPSLTPAAGFGAGLEDPDVELALYAELWQLLLQAPQHVLALLPLLLAQHQPGPLTVGGHGGLSTGPATIPPCPRLAQHSLCYVVVFPQEVVPADACPVG